REQKEDWQSLEAAGEEAGEPKRCVVAPLRVVEHEQQRLSRREPRREPVQTVDDRERCIPALPRLAGERRRRERGGSFQTLARAQQGVEPLAHDAERVVALELGAAGCEHERPLPLRRLPERTGEVCLADSG